LNLKRSLHTPLANSRKHLFLRDGRIAYDGVGAGQDRPLSLQSENEAFLLVKNEDEPVLLVAQLEDPTNVAVEQI
jgi:hypothetical protein